MWTIYCVTHRDSGRRYIGQTRLTVARRWKGHVANAKASGSGHGRLAGAIRKYGRDAFTHSVLETCASVAEANGAEEAWIESFSSRSPEFGFNTLRGGTALERYESAWDRPGVREAASARAKALWNDPAFRSKCTSSGAATLTSPGVRAKIAETKASPEWRAAQSARSKEIQSRPEVKAKSRAAIEAAKSTSAFKMREAERRAAIQASRTHCRRGHEMTPENTRRPTPTSRLCRACLRDGARARHVPKAPKPPRTHCRHGHEFPPLAPGAKQRKCVQCAAEWRARYSAARISAYQSARAAGLSVSEARLLRDGPTPP